MSEFDISKIKKLTREDLDRKEHPKLTLEGLKRMCNYLDEENPATYEIFLKYRPDLPHNEVDYYKDIIRTLHENNRLKRQIINESCNTYNNCNIESTPVVVYDSKLNAC